MVFRGEFTMRLFNPITMTEVIHGFHDTVGAIELPEDNWFFTMREIPEGMRLEVNEKVSQLLWKLAMIYLATNK